jgi:subtilisin family serine protease
MTLTSRRIRTPGETSGKIRRTQRHLALIVLVALLAPGSPARGSQFTPLAWQQPIEEHAIQGMAGQRKHTTWIRDRNRNFVDDEIERRYQSGELVDIVVDLNTCRSLKEIQTRLGAFGRITYIGKLITYVLVDDVRYDDVATIAALPEVAMVEIQEIGQIMDDVSARTVQSRPSVTFSPNTAGDAGFAGAGVNIAVLDTGVDDGHEQFAGKFVAGFHPLIFEDTNLNGLDDSCEPAPLGNGVCTDPDDDPADGTRNPDDDHSHGSHVAGIALGGGVAGRACSTPDDGSPTDCGGIATGAGLVDIKICNSAGGCPTADVAEALDWIGLNRAAFGIRVANLSIGYCTDDDGTSAMAQQVNYVSSLGVVMAVALGNASNCGLVPGTVRTMFPGSSSFAITVGGTDDRDTVGRGDDTNYSQFLRGPRNDFNVASPNLLALKPDLAGPGQNVSSARFNSTNLYFSQSGTSMASPQVAGAAAVVISARQAIDPGSVKDLLKRSADPTLNTAAFPAVDPVWDTDFGAGMLNVWPAVSAAATTDVGFPTCVGPPGAPGQPCALSGGLPSWNNSVDIDTTAPPQQGVANVLTADVRNSGAAPATALVNFGVYTFGAGNNQFFHVGTQQVTVPAGATVTVNQPWTPASSGHQCAQVEIDFGFDSNFDNNVTQRNLAVAPSLYTVRIENPFPVPAKFEVRAKSKRDAWTCKVSETRFTLHPYRDCPKEIEVAFDAPRDAREGDRADCDVGIFATPLTGNDSRERLIGGVTVRTFVPKPCRMVGWVRDEKGRSLAGVRVTFAGTQGSPEPRTYESDADGVLSLAGTPYKPQAIGVESRDFGVQRLDGRLSCGVGAFELVLSTKEARLVVHRRPNDWFADGDLRAAEE